ncbi:PAS domain-containing sensor histidine kinase [Chitinophagaceae bacterium 26-R-25]|nr:PAS domain-containing sensor histidine kinase [Chitinophagaceae bacterium 26-R-25]
MKETKPGPRTLSRILIISYTVLLVFVVPVRFMEYRQTHAAVTKINEISQLTSRKLTLLTTSSNGIDSAWNLLLLKVYSNQKKTTEGNDDLLKKLLSETGSNLSAFEKLISNKSEHMILDKVIALSNQKKQLTDSLYASIVKGNFAPGKLHLLVSNQINLSENYEAANHQLVTLVNNESKENIAAVNAHILLLAKRKELSSYFVILLLLMLGISIGNTLQRLRRTEHKYRVLFDFNPLPIWFVDVKSLKILEANFAAVKKYGYSKEDFLHLTPFDLRRSDGNEKENLESEFRSLSEAENSFLTNAKHYSKTGELLDVEINSNVIYINRKKVFLVSINDVTEKGKLEKELTMAIIKTQEKERMTLGEELHDNVLQILASVQLYLDLCIKAKRDKKEYLKEAARNIALVTKEIRSLSHQAAPAFLEQRSLVDAIHKLLEDMNPEGTLNINFEFDAQILLLKMESDVKLNMYRILQEQLNNIKKYSGATEIHIELMFQNNTLFMNITDDGIGFDTSEVKTGIGLLNMKKRAELFSGTFTIDSTPQNGCKVSIEIPLPTSDSA